MVPDITLNNNVVIPQFGLGVWQAEGDDAYTAVLAALKAGYRLIDTAKAYGNEDRVGRAIKDSGIAREEIFVTTKLWNADHGHDSALAAFDESLNKLGLEYLDLYLIHWPVPSKDRYVETWKALEEIYRGGRVKAIGVSNFEPEHLDRLASECEVVPAVNQIELHPRFIQEPLRDYCKQHGIAVEAWSPIGGKGADLLDEPTLKEIGDAYSKTPAQVVLRWHIQFGNIVIPKSVHEERIKENFDIFDFELSGDDMTKISGLDTGTRVGPDPKTAAF